ncbi:hypothetical protein LINPERHAP1_LOCUS9282 [Linum perenne]
MLCRHIPNPSVLSLSDGFMLFFRDELTPMDIWILYNAYISQHLICLPHLIIQAMQSAASTCYSEICRLLVSSREC